MPGVKTEVGAPGPEAGAARYGRGDEPRSGGPGVCRAAGMGPGTFLGETAGLAIVSREFLDRASQDRAGERRPRGPRKRVQESEPRAV